MAIFSAGLKCTNSECKNNGREDIERWELKNLKAQKRPLK